MQPLVSPVDHESRYNSYRASDEQACTENTPLLLRFPQEPPNNPSRLTTVVVTLLLLMLVTGVVIGIYLLDIQSESENILPPVDAPLQLVSRGQWNRNATIHLLKSASFEASQAIVVQTDTRTCQGSVDCANLLIEIQDTADILPYNFLVSTGGRAYEGRGWKGYSSLFPDYPNSLVLAFIGNFTKVPPTRPQLEAAKLILAESVSQQHLAPNYVLFGKDTLYKPVCLFESMKKHPKWDSRMTDGYVP